MRANKTFLFGVTAIAAILLCIALANVRYIFPPRLMIKFYGKPASNVTLILPIGSGRQYQLDADGSITARALGSADAILIPKPDGGGVSVHFPQYGTKVVDFRGRMVTTTYVRYFGLVSEEFESYTLTDLDVADIESGRKSSEEIVEEIRRSEYERLRTMPHQDDP